MQTERFRPELIPGERVEPRCRHAGACGGCSMQDLAYEAQLAWKQQRLLTLLGRIGLEHLPLDVVGLPDPWHYRHKMEFTFGQDGEAMSLGLHRRGSFWRIVNLEECYLTAPLVADVVRTARQAAADSQLAAYNPKRHVGFWRFLIVRHSRFTGKLLLLCVTNRGEGAPVERLAKRVMSEHPEVSGFWWGTTSRVADIAVPESLTCLAGEPLLEERIGHLRLKLHPMNFVQPSVEQAARIYQDIADAAGLDNTQIVYDLYCGIGAIGLSLAERADRVLGIESDEHNVRQANEHIALNRLKNVTIVNGRVEVLLTNPAFRDAPPPDVVVVDPPRAGVGKPVIDLLAQIAARRVIYLSCNPESLIQDLSWLRIKAQAYKMKHVKAFDMFAHSRHMETLVVLEREN